MLTKSIKLNNNKFRDIAGLSKILDQIMYQPCNKLGWIDLSHNFLTSINLEAISQWTSCTTLYLHSNYISDFKEIKKLSNMKNLKFLTL